MKYALTILLLFNVGCFPVRHMEQEHSEAASIYIGGLNLDYGHTHVVIQSPREIEHGLYISRQRFLCGNWYTRDYYNNSIHKAQVCQKFI